jgi:ATP-dependent Clp protease ATP-binding subunit ClpB
MQPTDPNKFTDKAWEAIVKSQDVVRAYQQQQLDVEHLMIALLEEPTGLATRILARCEVDPFRLQQQVEGFIQRQPKVGKNEQLYLGRNLDIMLDRAEEARVRMKGFLHLSGTYASGFC